MKKILSLATLILLVCSQPSFANDWFKQQPSESQPTVPEPGDNKPIPKTVDPQLRQSPALMLRQPCDRAELMFETLKNYKEHLLFMGEGMTFGIRGNPYNGAMMFFTNQDTGSWTVLQVYADGMACMIFNGKKFKPYGGDQPDYGEKQ